MKPVTDSHVPAGEAVAFVVMLIAFILTWLPTVGT